METPVPMPVRTICLTASILTIAGTSSAQRIGLGVKGGPVLGKTSAIHINTTPILGGTVGIYMPYHAGSRFEIQPEVMFTMTGSSYRTLEGSQFTDRSMYLNVPLACKYFLGNVFNVQGGIQMGKLINSNRLRNGTNTDVSDKYKAMDFGLHAGIGMDLTTGWDLTLRYYNGMVPILMNDDALFPKNRALQITAGYRFMHFREIGTSYRRR